MKQNKTLITCGWFYREAVRERRSYPILLLLLILLSALAPFINIIAPKYIIEELMGGQNVQRLIGIVVITIGGNFILAQVHTVLQETRTKQEDWFGRKFNMLLSKKSIDMKFANTEKEEVLDAEHKAEIGMSWYSGGIRGMSDCVIWILSAAGTFVGVVYIVVQVSPWLLLASLIAVIVNTFCTSKINRASQEVFEKTPAINKFYSYIYTRMNFREYAKELRLYDGAELVEKKSMDNAKQLNDMDNECAVKQFSWGIPGVLVSALSYGFSYCYLGVMAITGKLSVGEFVMCITALDTFTNGCLLQIISNCQQLVLKCNFMSAFIDFLKLDSEKIVETEEISLQAFEELSLENVSFKYPGREEYVLKDINLTIRKGERLSIVGLNGAGKSTLVKLICRLYDVTEGTIRMNGRNIREYRYEDYFKILSVVFQDFKLFGYTLDENICMGEMLASKEQLQQIYETGGIAEWVQSLAKKGDTLLSKDYDAEGVEPSGGQAQKIAIARALYHNGPMVILDEPTAALDPVAEYEIYNRFDELVRDKTAIYISHRLSSCRFCDRIIVLSDKKIAEEGSHEQLMEREGLYAQLFRTQAQWYVGVN